MSNVYLRGPRAATAFVSRMVKEMPKVIDLMAVESDNLEMRELIGALRNAAIKAECVREERKARRAGQQQNRRDNAKPKRGTATYGGILRNNSAHAETIRQRNANRGKLQFAA